LYSKISPGDPAHSGLVPMLRKFCARIGSTNERIRKDTNPRATPSVSGIMANMWFSGIYTVAPGWGYESSAYGQGQKTSILEAR